jgi:hypothetical protein
MPDGRVLIAFDDVMLAEDPAWTRLDDEPGLVAGINIRRGRQTEFDQTDASTATIYINDRNGLFDPDNVSSPYFGELDGKQIMLQLWNPVAEEWVTQFRGFVDEYGWTHRGSQVVSDVQIDCTDLFDYLGSVKMIPGLFGDTPPAGYSGIVFYEETDFQTRVTQLLADAGLPADFFRVFTGNVDVQDTPYDPDDEVVGAIRDALDAEFPAIANAYTDKLGRFVVHGRFARFDPDGVSATTGGDWNFTRWKAGDGAAITTDPDRAQIRPPLTWSRGRSRVINAAIAYPHEPDDGDRSWITDQIVVDTTSRDNYGYRSWEARDLITAAGTTTGNDARDETKLFAEYYVANYKDPRTRVEALTFKSMWPNDSRAEPSWALVCGADVSDIIDLEHGYPGGDGISQEFYIEGSEMQIRPGPPDFDFVTLTLNVSPQAYFTEDVFSAS